MRAMRGPHNYGVNLTARAPRTVQTGHLGSRAAGYTGRWVAKPQLA